MNNIVNQERRFGKIGLSRHVLEDLSYNELRDILRNFIILRAEMNYATGRIEYTAMSHLFDSLDQDEVTPEYIINVHQVNGCFDHVTVSRYDHM